MPEVALKPQAETLKRIYVLLKSKTLLDFALDSLDGVIGKVRDLYFDDQYWTIRYLVADTGNWLTDRQVLISPHALVAMNKDERLISVKLTQKQIEGSPSLDSALTVSRQFEAAYFGYYQWPKYWVGPHRWGAHPGLVRDDETLKPPPPLGQAWDPHLRSTHAVLGYHIQALDGEIGHVVDFIIDDETWAIRYLVVDTQEWWLDKHVLVAPQWLGSVSWNESKVFINLTRETLKLAPEYTDWSVLTEEFEAALHHYYMRQGGVSEAPAQPAAGPPAGRPKGTHNAIAVK